MISKNAYAKLNLHLNVLCKRLDGFHPIESIMTLVDLHDDILLDVQDGDGISLSCDEIACPQGEENLIVKATKCFLDFINIRKQVQIHLIKRIPMGAGLGGGSSDAATTLLLLNTYFQYVLSDKALQSLANTLGSDVAFCLQSTPCFCEGRGEILTPLPSIPKLYFLVACSGEHVNTKEAYFLLDESHSYNISSSKEQAMESYFENDYSFFFNSFEKVILDRIPKAKEALQIISSSHPLFARMSGSGSTVFGAFSSYEEASKVGEQLSIPYSICKQPF